MAIRRFVSKIDLFLAIIFFVLVMIATLFGAISRYAFAQSVPEIDELSSIAFVWFLYFSMIYCVFNNELLSVDVVDSFLSAPARVAVGVIADLLVVGFSAVMTYYSLELVIYNIGRSGGVTPMLSIPYYIVYLILPVAFFSFTVASGFRIAGRFTGDDGTGAAPGTELKNGSKG